MGEALWEEGRASNQFLRTPEEMWGALWRTVDLVRELASGLARDLGVVYPASLDETMTSSLRSLQRLARA
jgi:hypothetical protein